MTPDVTVPGLEVSDFTMNGAVCYPDSEPPECVAWGGFTPQGGFPDPAAAGGANNFPGADQRRDGAYPADRPRLPDPLGEPADDVGPSSTDFALTAPSPRNNSMAPTERACGTGAAKKKKCKKHKKKPPSLYSAKKEMQEEAPDEPRRADSSCSSPWRPLGTAVMASSASATFHLQKIREISPGIGRPDDSYVEIQAYSDFPELPQRRSTPPCAATATARA